MKKEPETPTHFFCVPLKELYDFTVEDTSEGSSWRINALYDVDSMSPRTRVRFVRLYLYTGPGFGDSGAFKRSKGIRYKENSATLYSVCTPEERLEAETFMRLAITELQRTARAALDALDAVAAELERRPFAKAAK